MFQQLAVWSEIGPGGQDGYSFIEAARRAQIVESAIETIAEAGYARASMAQIAPRAGISKGVTTSRTNTNSLSRSSPRRQRWLSHPGPPARSG